MGNDGFVTIRKIDRDPEGMPVTMTFPLEERLKACDELGDYVDEVVTRSRGPQQQALASPSRARAR